MPHRLAWRFAWALSALLLHGAVNCARSQTPDEWPIHSLDRPQPAVVDPGPPPPPTPPPFDAIVLFDGSDLSRWGAEDGGPAPWRIVDGAIEVVAHTGSLVTRDSFGSDQLHVEWATPAEVAGEGQERGNSGQAGAIFGLEVVQILMTAHRSAEEGRMLEFPPTDPDGFVPAVARGTWRPAA